MREIEIKLALEDPDGIRAALRRIGAERVGACLESNTLYDTATAKLRQADIGLRLRVERGLDERGAVTGSPETGRLTWKGPRQPGAVRSREELETPVGDAATAARILERLGYQPTVHFEKRRETWRLADAVITVDELPLAGWFLEIEAPSAERVLAVRQQLGLEQAAPVRDTYVDMAARLGGRTAGGLTKLRF